MFTILFYCMRRIVFAMCWMLNWFDWFWHTKNGFIERERDIKLVFKGNLKTGNSRNYVKTARNSSITMLPGFSLRLRWPVSQSNFKTHSGPFAPCLLCKYNLFNLSIKSVEALRHGLTISKMCRFVGTVHALNYDDILYRIFPAASFLCYAF